MSQHIPGRLGRVGDEIDNFRGLIQFVLSLKGLPEYLEGLFPRNFSERKVQVASTNRGK